MGGGKQVLEVIGRSRVSKLFVMRSLLLTDEEAHRPERYLEVPDEPAAEGLEGVTQNAEEVAAGVQEQLAVPLVGGRRPSDSSRMEAGGFGGSERRVSTGKGEGGGVRVSGEDEEGAGDEELRYHRQLRRYREYLQQEVRARGERREEREREREHVICGTFFSVHVWTFVDVDDVMNSFNESFVFSSVFRRCQSWFTFVFASPPPFKPHLSYPHRYRVSRVWPSSRRLFLPPTLPLPPLVLA